MQAAERKRPTPLGGILALVGGALLVIGSFLDWAEVSGTGTTVTASGTEGMDGWITLVAGAIALVVGLAMMRGVGKRAVGVLAIVAGLVGGGVGVLDALTAKDSVLDSAAEELAREFGGSVEEMRALLDAAIDAGDLGVTVAIGLYLVIAGGALAIVGGVITLRRASAVPAMPVTFATPPEATPSAASGTSEVPSAGIWAAPTPAHVDALPEPAPPPPPAPAAPEKESEPGPDADPLSAPESDPEPGPDAEPPVAPEIGTDAPTEPPPSPWPTSEPPDGEETGPDKGTR
jgi:Tryptophan-associated transmembrane protein (Trp_oprn_chp)